VAKIPVWRRPVGDFPSLLHLGPPVVHVTDSLSSVVSALAGDPHARAVFVVDDDDRLLGIIPERRLDTNLVRLVLPQSIWPSIGDLDARTLLHAAKGAPQTAHDLMVPCDATTPDALLQDLLVGMIRRGDSATPLIDEQGRLLGYLSLFELLANLLRQSDA